MKSLGNTLFPQPGQEIRHLVVKPPIRLLSRGVPHGVIRGHGMSHISHLPELPRVVVAQLNQMLARRARLKPPIVIGPPLLEQL